MTEWINQGLLIDHDTGARIPYRMNPLKSDQIPAMLVLQQEIFETGGFDLRWFYPFREEELEEILEDPANLVLGVYVEEKLVAFRVSCGSGTEFEEVIEQLGGEYQTTPCFLLNGALVGHQYRGNNLQQLMSEHTVNWCRERGIQVFVVTVHPDNAPSIKSLENIGFIKRKRTLLYNQQYDRLILVKE